MNTRILYDPKKRRYVVTYDDYGMVDTIVRNGRVLSSTNKEAKVILDRAEDLLYNPLTTEMPAGWTVP